MNFVATYKGKAYRLEALNESKGLGIYKNSTGYLLATKDNKVLIEFEVTKDIIDYKIKTRFGQMGF